MEAIRDKQPPMSTQSGAFRGDGGVQKGVERPHRTATRRSDAWFQRQLAHAQACIAEADKQHTPEEIAAAEAALAIDQRSPQEKLFERRR